MLIVAKLLAGLTMLASTQQSPPIFQPGAPGQPTRTVSAEQAVALSRTTFTPGDVAFMQHMLVHHAQAVEMVALLETQGTDPVVARLGQRIGLSQAAEMALMQGWLSDRDQPTAMAGMDHSGMDHSGMDHAAMGHAMPDPADVAVMPGMLTPRQMQTLSAARGQDFDRLFLSGMIQHHQGALDMVDELMAGPNAAQDPMLSDFATSVVADQSAEILRMQSILSTL